MAIFNLKNKTKKVSAKVSTKAEPVKAVATIDNINTTINMSARNFIIKPHITEKSGIQSQGGVYTFIVSDKANKEMIGKAIFSIYKIHPAKVAIVNLPPKLVFRRGKKGRVSGVRKAIITVKKGDKIDFV